jgi:hypothetical protein
VGSLNQKMSYSMLSSSSSSSSDAEGYAALKEGFHHHPMAESEFLQ